MSPLPLVHDVIVTAAHAFPVVPAFHVDPVTQLVHMPLLLIVAGVRPFPAEHEVIVTATQECAFDPALLYVEPSTQLAHEPSLVVVPGVSSKPSAQEVVTV